MYNYYLVFSIRHITALATFQEHIIFRCCIGINRVFAYIELNNIKKYSIYSFTDYYDKNTYKLIVKSNTHKNNFDKIMKLNYV